MRLLVWAIFAVLGFMLWLLFQASTEKKSTRYERLKGVIPDSTITYEPDSIILYEDTLKMDTVKILNPGLDDTVTGIWINVKLMR